MKTQFILSVVITLSLITLFRGIPTEAQTGQTTTAPVTLIERNLGGPRLGLTFVTGNSELWQRLEENKMGRLLSQFGWHFEYQVIPEGGGPCFVVQTVPLVAGVEYGKLIPSCSLLMGIRFPNGIEFGLGPNLIITGGDKPARTALVLGVGKSINYGGVSIPLNLVYATNPEGNRISFIFGYAITKTK
jgi:hypothetical protein